MYWKLNFNFYGHVIFVIIILSTEISNVIITYLNDGVKEAVNFSLGIESLKRGDRAWEMSSLFIRRSTANHNHVVSKLRNHPAPTEIKPCYFLLQTSNFNVLIPRYSQHFSELYCNISKYSQENVRKIPRISSLFFYNFAGVYLVEIFEKCEYHVDVSVVPR